MTEYVIDDSKNALVVTAGGRSKRPKGVKAKGCPFCRGSEHLTPPTLIALPDEKKWRTRVFENAFPFLQHEKRFERIPGPAFGHHWVIVETGKHGEFLQHFDDAQLKLLWLTYKTVFEKLENAKGVKSVFLFRNHGEKAGASIQHEHAQVAAFPFVYPVLKKELENYNGFKARTGKCWYCELAKKRKNVLFSTKHFVAIAVDFGRFNCETWIIPKRHCAKSRGLTGEEGLDLLKALKEIAKRVEKFVPDYNMAFHSAPQGKEFHFHVEVYPRRAIWAGVEHGAGIVINSKAAADTLAVLGNKRI